MNWLGLSRYVRGNAGAAFAIAPTPTPTPTPTPSPTPTPTPTPTAADYTVSDLAGLNAAMLSAFNAGGNKVIACNAGSYGDWTPTARTFPANVTITAADPANKPVFNSITLDTMQRVIVTGVQVSNAALVAPAWLIKAVNSTNVQVSSNVLRGNATRDGWGLSLVDSANVTVQSNDIQQLGVGMVLLRTTSALVKWNKIRNFEADGIDVYGGNVNPQILSNLIYDFFPLPGDHSDGIQVDQNNASTTSGALLDDNCIVRTPGSGSNIQGILMGDTLGLDNVNFTATNNLIIGCTYHAITLYQGRGTSTISGNKVYGFDYGDGTTSWIQFNGCSGTVIRTNNQSPQYVTNTTTYTTDTNNTTPAGISLGTDAAARDALMAAWVAAHPQVPA
jgi:hypothetical protein